jgi:hypothetical protein
MAAGWVLDRIRGSHHVFPAQYAARHCGGAAPAGRRIWAPGCLPRSANKPDCRSWLCAIQSPSKSALIPGVRMIDSSAMPPRHAGEGRYLRLLFVAARKAVDTGLRRHDDVCGARGSILRIPGMRRRPMASRCPIYPAVSRLETRLTKRSTQPRRRPRHGSTQLSMRETRCQRRPRSRRCVRDRNMPAGRSASSPWTRPPSIARSSG